MKITLDKPNVFVLLLTEMEKIYSCNKCGTKITPNKYPFCMDCLALLRTWLSDVDYHVGVAERNGENDYLGYSEQEHNPPKPIKIRQHGNIHQHEVGI
jgi:hypothetical protein